MLGILKMDNPIQRYAWGSTAMLARLCGRPPAAEPEAELWMGAHPQAPSAVTVAGRRVGLDRLLAERPRAALGAVADRFGARLPFLLKVLAVARPLSIQAHPSRAQAEAGYAREEAAGIARAAAHRNYRDRNHKPEVVVALEPYWLLSGFRSCAEIGARLRDLGGAALQPAVGRLLAQPGPAALRALVATLLGLAEPQRAELVARAAAGAEQAERAAADDPAARWVRRLAAEYPADAGVLAPYLLNLVRLAPGEGLHTAAGVLHTSLQGSGVELQANSDNVLRCGLTPKHVDVPELLRIGRFEPGAAQVIRGSVRRAPATAAAAEERHYATPAAEFALSEIRLAGGPAAAATGGRPEVLLVLDGPCAVTDDAGRGTPCRPGDALFVPACVAGWNARGAGRLFRARVPHVNSTATSA